MLTRSIALSVLASSGSASVIGGMTLLGLEEVGRRRCSIPGADERGPASYGDDGRIEIDSNVVERSIRPIALNRKNALFAGSDGGGEHWAIIASLIETCKLCSVEPHAYLTDVITKIINGYPNSQIDDLLPWAYATAPALKHVA